MRKWLGLHGYSTWMVVASIVVMAATVHPSLLAYLLVAVNAGWMILTREVARYEGVSHEACRVCIIAGAVVLVLAAVLLLKVNWLAL
jgi:hypothetical protein